MHRRAFITSLSAIAVPAVADSSPPRRLARVGYLQGGVPVPERTEAFLRTLGELGWVEGQNLTIEYRFADNKPERLAAMAAELARLNVDVILTSGSTVVRAAREATSTIPIVMATSEPVSAGLVGSLSSPGGNITGLTQIPKDLIGKRFELLKELVPNVLRVVAVLNPSNPAQAQFTNELESSARALALQLKIVKLQDRDEFEAAFAAMIEWQARGFLLLEDTLFTTHRVQIADLALRHRLPAVYGNASYVMAGGLASYGADFTDLYRRAAGYVDKVLRGIKPRDLPIEQPTKFEFMLNLKTAKTLGLTVPQSLLLRADTVLQ